MTRVLAHEMTEAQKQASKVITEYRETFEVAIYEHKRALEQKAKEPYLYVPDKPRINWTEDWDGLLVERVHKIADAGYLVSRVLRSQKIFIRLKDSKRTPQQFTNDMFHIFKTFRGVSFDPTSIWWGVRSTYRG